MEAKNFDQTDFSSRSTKKIEELGTEAFEKMIKYSYGDRCTYYADIRNKGKASKNKNEGILELPGCDVILSIDDTKYYIELKTSGNSKLPTNIRFTHQTISKMNNSHILQDLIVVCVYNLKEGIEKAKFEFFKFGEINVNDIKVEPHFIVQSNKFRKDSESEVDSFEKSFNEVLEATTISDESSYEKLFNSMVREHMNLLKKNSP